MASLNDLKQAIVDAFAGASENLDRAATVTQAAADALRNMASGGGIGENPMVQELVDLVKADSAEMIAKGNALIDSLASAIPHAEPTPTP